MSRFKCASALILVLVVGMAAFGIFERCEEFIAVFLSLSLIWALCRIGLCRKGVFLLHLSFLIMLIGGGVTHFSAVHGNIQFVPNRVVDKYLAEDGRFYGLSERLQLDRFHTEFGYDGVSPQNYCARLLTDGGTTIEIGMNENGQIGNDRLFLTSFDDDGGVTVGVTRDVWGFPIVFSAYLLFCIVGYMVMIGRRQLRDWRLWVGLLVVIVVIVVWRLMSVPSLPILHTAWLPVHMALVFAGYVVLAMTFAVSMTALFVPKKSALMWSKSRAMICYGVYLLSLGIIAGSLWANVSWGRYWGWDPKETWALITVMVYAVPLHFRGNVSVKLAHVYVIMAILSIVMTCVGVNQLSSIHAY